MSFLQWAPTPPMGWNSWDCFGAAVTEQQTLTNADYMAAHLRQHGWQYIVVDIQWYEPNAKGWEYHPGAKLAMDDYGRLNPAENRFPSAAGGAGFKALGDAIHSRGLKFGLHIMRGIPRQAVEQNTPVLGTSVYASDIANKNDPCAWNTDMWGVDMTKPGAQAYYDSIFAQFATWGLDFVKVDDLSRPYHLGEIEAIRKAIDLSGRAIVFSTSPGPTPIGDAAHVSNHANMWRISDDFWDKWSLLHDQFSRCASWASYSGEGHYPDADMLPLGAIRASKSESTHFTHDEQYTVMTLWSICRSPLIFGGNLPQMDDFTLSLITNDEVLAVDQHSHGAKQLFRRDNLIAWSAQADDSDDKYLAVFNLRNGESAAVAVSLANDLGFDGPCNVRDLWKRSDLAAVSGEFAPVIPSHGAGFYRISASKGAKS